MDRTVESYNKIASSYANRNSDRDYWAPEFKEFQQLVRGRKILDVGCGTGRDTRFFLGNRFEYLGIDASKAMLDIAKRDNPTANFNLMDFTNLEFPEESFDCFWAAASLVHVPKNNIDQALQSLRRVIRKYSIGFISVREGWVEGLVEKEHYKDSPLYFSDYNVDELSDVIKRNQFEIERAHKKTVGNRTWLCVYARKV